MRVAIVTSSLSAGGAERQAALWAAAAHDQGHRVSVLALHAGGAEYWLPDAVEVTRLAKRGAADQLRIARAVRRAAQDADVLVAFQAYIGMFCALQPLSCSWMVVTGEDPRRFGDTSRFPRRLLELGLRRAALRTAPTSGLVDCHRDLGIAAGGEWMTIPNIVDPAAFGARADADRGGALVVGRLVPEKDPLLAVRAAAAAGVPVTFLGAGPLEAAVVEESRRLGSQASIAPFTPEPWDVYARHRVLLVTSRYEAFGNVIVEALAAGTPVVAGDCDFGPREVLAQLQHSRVVPRDEAALTAVLAELAARPPGAAERDECVGRAQEYRLEAVGPSIAGALARVAGVS